MYTFLRRVHNRAFFQTKPSWTRQQLAAANHPGRTDRFVDELQIFSSVIETKTCLWNVNESNMYIVYLNIYKYWNRCKNICANMYTSLHITNTHRKRRLKSEKWKFGWFCFYQKPLFFSFSEFYVDYMLMDDKSNWIMVCSIWPTGMFIPFGFEASIDLFGTRENLRIFMALWYL